MTFVYLGHGMDLLVRRKPDIRTVPEGCTYSTIAHTGLSSGLSSVLNLNYISVSHLDLLMEPEKNYSKLSRLFTGELNSDNYKHKNVLSDGDYHLKIAGEHYTNNHCSFFFEFGFDRDNTIVTMYRSGLYNVETPLTPLPRLQNESYMTPSYYFVIDTKIGVDIDLIPLIYKDSLFPTSDEIIREIKKTNDNQVIPYDLFSRSVYNITKSVNSADLMEKFPGNHYNFPCRDFANDNHSFNNSLYRKESINFQNRRSIKTRKIKVKQSRLGTQHFKHFVKDMGIKFDFDGTKKYEVFIGIFNIRFELFSKKFIPFAQEFVNEMFVLIENNYFTKYDIDSRLKKLIIDLLKKGKLEGNVSLLE